MDKRPIQDYYGEAAAVCYGCGRLNEHGLHIKSYWDGEEAVCCFRPQPYHTAVPGYVYGGLLASLIDCHSTGRLRQLLMTPRTGRRTMTPRSVLSPAPSTSIICWPTPIDAELEVRAWVKELTGRKVVVHSSVYANGEVTVRGEAVCVRMPEHFLE